MRTTNKIVPSKAQAIQKLKELANILGITSNELQELAPTMELATNLYTHKDFTLLEFGKAIRPDVLQKIKLPVINEQFVHLPFNVLKSIL